jgi:hypothetical protein
MQRSRGLRRLLATLAATIAVTLIFPTPNASAGTTVPLPAPAAVPADFVTVIGYQPVAATLADGEQIAVNPHGGCSVPIGEVSADLQVACQAHDLGYDLLRYARQEGIPVGPEARQGVDADFAKNLAVQCAGRPDHDQVGCDATAHVFSSAVRFNSWRQLDGPPVAGSGIARTVGLCLAALALGGVGVLALRRPVTAFASRRRPPAPPAR